MLNAPSGSTIKPPAAPILGRCAWTINASSDLESMGRNYLKGRNGDRINAVLAAAGYNFGLLLHWLKRLLRALSRMLFSVPPSVQIV